MELLERIHLARDAGAIKRYHTARVIHEETVAEHSFNVVNLVMLLTDGCASVGLLMAALTHDMGEYATGDIPAPVKRSLPHGSRVILENIERKAADRIHPCLVVELTTEEDQLLRICDRMDGLLKCIDEVRLGNTHLIPIGERYAHYLEGIMEEECRFKTQIQLVINEFKELTNE